MALKFGLKFRLQNFTLKFHFKISNSRFEVKFHSTEFTVRNFKR
ncbi:hypothetical protein CAMGR0001_1155 [Campylobacter gracilis RM3268]|uniref:Uncharacterized protein n=1 Tax=Campylobacter gracilis RM3268 TaxID=553220 RepID=C8PIV7_9BACT|nr:hypothetical protein CAMGR0001_1155 [Campylobacter gracilis RM3268]